MRSSREVTSLQADHDQQHAVTLSGVDDAALLAAVCERLAQATSPGAVFGDLVADGVEPRAAAVATCVGGGTDRSVAEDRVHEYDDLWPQMEPGDEHDVGEVLERLGYFDHEPVLDDKQAYVSSLLAAAFAAVPGWPSGYAVGLSRRLRLAQFMDAIVMMERIGAQRWATNRDFWTKLSQAADAITTDPGQSFVEVRKRCHDRVSELGAP